MTETTVVGLHTEMESCVHALSQPLTTLLCRLELARLDDDATGIRAALDGCLRDFTRVQKALARMRQVLDVNEEGGR